MSFVKEPIKDLDSDKAEKISYHEEQASFHFDQAIKHRQESEHHSNKFFHHQLEALKLRGSSMSSFSWQDGPEPDIDKWEENVLEQYEEYCEFTKEEGHYVMSYGEFRKQVMQEMEEHIAELQESYN